MNKLLCLHVNLCSLSRNKGNRLFHMYVYSIDEASECTIMSTGLYVLCMDVLTYHLLHSLTNGKKIQKRNQRIIVTKVMRFKKRRVI